MGIFIGDAELKECYVGTTPVKEIYVGDIKVWPTEAAEWVVTTSDMHEGVFVGTDGAPELMLTNGMPTQIANSTVSQSQFRYADGSAFPFGDGKTYGVYWNKPFLLAGLTNTGYVGVLEFTIDGSTGGSLAHIFVYSNSVKLLVGTTVLDTAMTNTTASSKTLYRSCLIATRSGSTIGLVGYVSLLETTGINTYEVSGSFTNSGSNSTISIALAPTVYSNGQQGTAISNNTGVASVWNYNTYNSSDSTPARWINMAKINNVFQSGDMWSTGRELSISDQNYYLYPASGAIAYIYDTQLYGNSPNQSKWALHGPATPTPDNGYPFNTDGQFIVQTMFTAGQLAFSANPSTIISIIAIRSMLSVAVLTGVFIRVRDSKLYIEQRVNGTVVDSAVWPNGTITSGLVIREIIVQLTPTGITLNSQIGNYTVNFGRPLVSTVFTQFATGGVFVSNLVGPNDGGVATVNCDQYTGVIGGYY